MAEISGRIPVKVVLVDENGAPIPFGRAEDTSSDNTVIGLLKLIAEKLDEVKTAIENMSGG